MKRRKSKRARIRAEVAQMMRRKSEPRTQYTVIRIFPGGHPGSGKRR